jgi:sulfite exporter TauE/SafE
MWLYAEVFVVSLLGSLHCAGMCGPLVAFAVGDGEAWTWPARARLNAAYHGARLAMYVLIGAVGGLIGAAVDLGATRMGLYRAASLLAGAMMIAVGIAAVLRYRGTRLPHWSLPRKIQNLLMAGQRAAVALRPLPRAASMGLLTALLPCGWLYLFAIAAAGTGSPLRGMMVMAAFWLGSVPVLLSLGVGVQALAGLLGRRVPLVTALAIVFVGASTLVLRTRTPVDAFAGSAANLAADPEQQVEDLRDTIPPCCKTSPP